MRKLWARFVYWAFVRPVVDEIYKASWRNKASTTAPEPHQEAA